MFYKNLLATLLALLLSHMPSFSQTAIIEKHIKGDFYNNTEGCTSYTYDLKVPLFHIGSNKGVLNLINDSIMHVANSFSPMGHFDYSPLPFYANYFTEDSCSQSIPDSYDMRYFVFQSNSNLLSILVNTIFSSDEGSGYFNKEFFCFNINLQTGSIINIDSLIKPSAKQKVLDSLIARYDKTYNIPYGGDDTANVNFLGINLSDTSLIAYYANHYYVSRTANIEVEIPLTNIQQYLNKQYVWLCQPKEKRKK